MSDTNSTYTARPTTQNQATIPQTPSFHSSILPPPLHTNTTLSRPITCFLAQATPQDIHGQLTILTLRVTNYGAQPYRIKYTVRVNEINAFSLERGGYHLAFLVLWHETHQEYSFASHTHDGVLTSCFNAVTPNHQAPSLDSCLAVLRAEHQEIPTFVNLAFARAYVGSNHFNAWEST